MTLTSVDAKPAAPGQARSLQSQCGQARTPNSNLTLSHESWLSEPDGVTDLAGHQLIARPGAADAELHAALRAVGATWADELPDGLDTEVGPQGHRLDSAQAQQLALSRVVLADPHTVILDEATALLDPTTARDTERALSAVLEGRTVVAIAHRLHTAHDADRVAVMEDGRLTELGTHDDLVVSGGSYARLWDSWHGQR